MAGQNGQDLEEPLSYLKSTMDWYKTLAGVMSLMEKNN